jgi:hypothetical protein
MSPVTPSPDSDDAPASTTPEVTANGAVSAKVPEKKDDVGEKANMGKEEKKVKKRKSAAAVDELQTVPGLFLSVFLLLIAIHHVDSRLLRRSRSRMKW